MKLHLRAIPDDIEFITDEPGILFNGTFFRLSKKQTKMVQILYANAGTGVSCEDIAKFSELKVACIKVIMGKIRPMIYTLKYSIRSLNARHVKDKFSGYLISKMVKK